MLIKKLSVRHVIWLVISIFILFFAVYWLKFRSLPVTGYTVAKGELQGEVMGTGTLEAHVKTTISPRIQERLANVFVDQGDTVKAGQLLARLDDAELKQQVAIAQATLASVSTTADRIRTDEARAKSTIVESRSQIVTAERNLQLRREQLAFTELRSPYDGLVVRRDRDPGVVPGSSILELIDTKEIWISAWVDETTISALAVGQSARVVFRSEPDRPYPGEVARLGREADRETREFLVDVFVRQLPVNWAVGQRAEAFIETGRKSSVVTIPQQFLLWRAGKPGVFVNDQGKAHWHSITLGLQGHQDIEVIKGLSVGDQIVKPFEPSNQMMADGQAVSVR